MVPAPLESDGRAAASKAVGAGSIPAGGTLTNMRVRSIMAWLGLVSYSAHFMPPVLLDVCDNIPFPQSYGRLARGPAGASAALVPYRPMPPWGPTGRGQARTCWGYWRLTS
jgi:hypothetical protein